MNSRSSTLIRSAIALALLIGVLALIYRGAPEPKAIMVLFASPGLLIYLTVSYLLRPKPNRGGKTMSRHSRKQLNGLKFWLAPGRFVSIAIIDLFALLLGKQADHQQFAIDVTDRPDRRKTGQG